nr:antitoxin Xre/MbcA/ParS toxin-binding domain-containing protein [uncultured Rhodopila sp.]
MSQVRLRRVMMPSERETAEVLGISNPTGTPSILWIAHEVSRGLPLAALERVAYTIAPDDKSFVYRFMPKATWARRRKAFLAKAKDISSAAAGRKQARQPGDRASREAAAAFHEQIPAARLSPEEGAKVARIAEVWTLARQVWGSDDAARAFLFRPHPMLEGQRPIDVALANEFGRPLVEGILGRLQYGSAA